MEWRASEIITLILLAFLTFIFLKIFKRKSNYPPGPFQLPIIGNLHQIGVEAHKTFIEMRKNYGDIFALKFGAFRVVVINEHKLVKKAFHDSAFSGRPKVQRTMDGDKGVIFTDGHVWTEQRRFALKTLRDFGLGKKTMEGIILEEAQALIEEFRQEAGKPMLMQTRFNAAVLNSLWAIVTGERYAHDDPRLMDLIQRLSSDVTNSRSTDPLAFFPIIGRIRKMFPLFFGNYIKSRAENAKVNLSFMRNAIQKHKDNYQEGSSQDFIEAYLTEINNTSDPHSSFFKTTGEKQLEYVLKDLFAAGAETTSTTLTWAFLLLALNPKIQEKLHEEIKSVVGLSRLPSTEDRPRLPYSEAVIMEVMRYSAIIPLAVFHNTNEDVQFETYLIPKDTIVFANLYCILKDPVVWGDPESFRPNRFLNSEGTGIAKHDAFIPFSTGKRVCLGESLARDELFLFLTCLLQRFRITTDPNGEKPTLDYYTAAVLVPKPHSLVLIDRFEKE